MTFKTIEIFPEHDEALSKPERKGRLNISALTSDVDNFFIIQENAANLQINLKSNREKYGMTCHCPRFDIAMKTISLIFPGFNETF